MKSRRIKVAKTIVQAKTRVRKPVQFNPEFGKRFTARDLRDVLNARMFFAESVTRMHSPKIERTLMGLISSTARVEAILQLEKLSAPAKQVSLNRAIEWLIGGSFQGESLKRSTAFSNEISRLRVLMNEAKKSVPGYKDEYVYGLIKQVWMPQRMKFAGRVLNNYSRQQLRGK